MEKFKIEEKIVAMLKTVYDPEIPVNVYDLGLIYKIDVSDNGEVALDMTLSSQLSGSRFHHGRYPPESRIGGRSDICHYQPCVRTGMG